MMGYEFIAWTALFLAQAAFLLLLPFVLLFVATRIVNGVHDARTPWTPYIELGALGVGIFAGACVLAHIVDPRMLKPSALLQVGGPWDMDFPLFVRIFANPFTYDLSPLFPPYTDPPVKWPGIAVFLLGGAIFYGQILFFRTGAALAGAIRNLVIMVWGTFATIYLFFLVGWMVNRLNFWVFLVLLFVVHKLRGAPRVVLRLSRRSF